MNIKQTIKNILQFSPTKNLEIDKIKIIRESKKEELKDFSFVENMLCELGLNDEELFNFPEKLIKYTGKGLQSWQYPSQFGKYLIKLTDYKINSYIEIGAKHGGTFIITTEYLNKFNLINKAIAIDLFSIKGVNEYKKSNSFCKSYAINSRSLKFKNLIERHGPFDLALIDGDHSYEGCKSDFLTMKNHCKILAFHDIVGMGVPGVVKLWNELKDKYSDEYDFFEFIDQYSEVKDKTNKTWLGLGLAVKKTN